MAKRISPRSSSLAQLVGELGRLDTRRRTLVGFIRQEADRLTGTEVPLPRAKGSRGRRKKRTMSPEGRARIAAAQKARWAKVKKGQKKEK